MCELEKTLEALRSGGSGPRTAAEVRGGAHMWVSEALEPPQIPLRRQEPRRRRTPPWTMGSRRILCSSRIFGSRENPVRAVRRRKTMSCRVGSLQPLLICRRRLQTDGTRCRFDPQVAQSHKAPHQFSCRRALKPNSTAARTASLQTFWEPSNRNSRLADAVVSPKLLSSGSTRFF